MTHGRHPLMRLWKAFLGKRLFMLEIYRQLSLFCSPRRNFALGERPAQKKTRWRPPSPERHCQLWPAFASRCPWHATSIPAHTPDLSKPAPFSRVLPRSQPKFHTLNPRAAPTSLPSHLSPLPSHVRRYEERGDSAAPCTHGPA